MRSIDNIKGMTWVQQRLAVVLRALLIGLVGSTAMFTLLPLPDDSVTDAEGRTKATSDATISLGASNQESLSLPQIWSSTSWSRPADQEPTPAAVASHTISGGPPSAGDSLTHGAWGQESSGQSLRTVKRTTSLKAPT